MCIKTKRNPKTNPPKPPFPLLLRQNTWLIQYALLQTPWERVDFFQNGASSLPTRGKLS